MAPKTDTVRIFDTTLRDGEQSPGIALNRGREGRDRPPARAAGRGRDRGRLRHLLAGEVEGDPRPSREGGRVRRRVAGAEPTTRTSTPPSSRCTAPALRASTCSSQLRHPHGAQAAHDARRRWSRRPTAPCGAHEPSPPTSSSRARTRPAPTPRFMAQVVRTAIAAGATTINIPDTVGYTVPEEYVEILAEPVRTGARAGTASSSRCTATTTWGWPWPTRWRA